MVYHIGCDGISHHSLLLFPFICVFPCFVLLLLQELLFFGELVGFLFFQKVGLCCSYSECLNYSCWQLGVLVCFISLCVVFELLYWVGASAGLGVIEQFASRIVV